MNVTKSQIHMSSLKCQIVTQMTLDDDFNVPDVNADIEKYITRDALVHLENIKTSEGKINIRGRMDFKILYGSGGDRQVVHSMGGSIPFDEIINGDKLSSGDSIHVKCDIDDLNIGIINTRKISVKAVLTLMISAEEMHHVDTVHEISDEGANYLREKTQMLEIVVDKKDIYRVREDMELPANKPNISSVLWHTVSLKNISTRLYEGKVGVSGELVLFLLYEAEEEDSPVQWMESVIPFDGSIDVAECREDMIGDIESMISSINVNMKPDYDGEQRMIELEVVLELNIKVYQETENEILKDVYSLQNELTPVYQDVTYSTLLTKNISKCKINDKLRMNKDSGHILQLLCAHGSAKIDDISIQEKGIAVEGIVQIKMMYVSSDDKMPLNIADEVVPFSHMIEAEGVTADSISFLRPSLEQIVAVMSGNNEIEVKCTVVLDTLILNNTHAGVITDVGSQPFDLKKLQNIPSMAGYIVKEKDSMWDIAKRYCTTIPSIMKVNDKKDEKIHSGEMLIIMKETP